MTGGTGNAITATTGNNTSTAAAGSNSISANAANQSNNLTANATSGTNNIEAKTNNIGVATANSVNTIGNAGTSTNTITGATNAIIGTTNVNVSHNFATNINTGTSTGAVTVGNALNTTNLNSATNNIGVSSGYATFNNIGTNSAFASTNAIGSTNAGTTVTATGGNSYLSVANGTAGLRSGSGLTASGFTTTSAARTLDATDAANLATQLNNVGDAASRQNIAGASYVNRLEGNTLINGNTYINGTLEYTSNSSATTTVTSGESRLTGATQATRGQMAIVNYTTSGGSTGAKVDGNGRIYTGIVEQTTGSLVITNGLGETHGFVVNETSATMSGGVRSTSLTLSDTGAHFSNAANGAPVRVSGVADGENDFDAVNYRQLKNVAAGVAGASAAANIPQVEQNKKYLVGVGLGNFQNQTAMAFGGSLRLAPNAVVKASIATNDFNNKRTVYGLGVGLSW